jgi:hypothetical protein
MVLDTIPIMVLVAILVTAVVAIPFVLRRFRLLFLRPLADMTQFPVVVAVAVTHL